MSKRRPRVKFFSLGNHQNCKGDCSKSHLREFFNPDYSEVAEAAANGVQKFMTSKDYLLGLVHSGSTSRLESYHASLLHQNLLGNFSKKIKFLARKLALKAKSGNPQTSTNIPNCGVFICSLKMNIGHLSTPTLLKKVADWTVSDIRLQKMKNEVKSKISFFSLKIV